jgi:hypothetical protein
MSSSDQYDRLTKAARLMILLELQERGVLDGLTLQQIADLFHDPPNRSTILRDLRMLPQVKTIRNEMRKHVNKNTKRPTPRKRSAGKAND